MAWVTLLLGMRSKEVGIQGCGLAISLGYRPTLA